MSVFAPVVLVTLIEVTSAVQSAKKNDLSRLVALAMYNRFEVEPLNSSKIEALSPELANGLKNASRQSLIKT